MADLKKLLRVAKKRMKVFPFEPCVIGSIRVDGENISTHNEKTCPTCKSRIAWGQLQKEING